MKDKIILIFVQSSNFFSGYVIFKFFSPELLWSFSIFAFLILFQVIYAIVFCSQLKPGETILIHSAGSPAGQAAINLATYFGIEILVTVSSVDEKLFVRENFPVVSPLEIFAYIPISSF